MPLSDGTYPPQFVSLQEMEDDSMSEASDDVHDNKLPYNPKQKVRHFKERVKLCQRNTGRLPMWLGQFRIPGMNSAKRDNLFRGMYGLGFTYDHHQNIVYADNEAVEAAQAPANRQEYPIPHRMGCRPNPRGFPMTIWEVQESIRYIHAKALRWQSVLQLLVEFHRIAMSVIARYRDLSMHDVIEQFYIDRRLTDAGNDLPALPFIPLDPRHRRGGGGSLVGGAGLPPPGDATLDDWCQYAAHHFHPGGVNSPNGITMDLSHRVSYASIWGMLMLCFLHPMNARNYYGWYLAGIAFHLHYYTNYIKQWNHERTKEPQIVQAAGLPVFRRMIFNDALENLSELDVIQHLAACAITQAIIDSAYLWAMVWIDQHTSIHFRDHFRQLETARQERIKEFSEPEVLPELQGWWTLDIGDTHWIRVLSYQEQYGQQAVGHVQENPLWLLHGESMRFQYINTYPPTAPGPHVPGPQHEGLPNEDESMAPAMGTAIDGGRTSDTELNGSADDEGMANLIASLDHPTVFLQVDDTQAGTADMHMANSTGDYSLEDPDRDL